MTRTYASVRRRWWATVVALVAMLVVAWLPSPVAASESPVGESHSTPWAAPTYEYDVASVPRGHGADRYDVDANLVAVAADSDDRRTIGQRPSVARSEPSRASSAELDAPRGAVGALDDAAGAAMTPAQRGQYLFNNWHRATFPNRTQSINYHLGVHGNGRTAFDYTRDAQSLFAQNRGLATQVTLKDGSAGLRIQTKVPLPGGGTNNVGGYWTTDGRLVTFWD